MGSDATPLASGPANRKSKTMANGNGGVRFLPWIMGILGALIIAGVLASFGTMGTVSRLDENLTLFREEVRRDLSRHERQIEALDEKLDLHRRADGGGGS